MRIAQVIGKLTVSRVHPTMAGLAFRLVQPLSLTDAVNGSASNHADLIASIDVLGSGMGDLILLAEGPEAAQPFLPDKKPADAYNAAILDSLSIDARMVESL